MIGYDKIIRNAALRVSALKGGTSVAKEANLAITPLTATQIGTLDFPITSIKDAVLSNVGRLVRAYASVKNHPFRTYNLSQTGSLANEAILPSLNSASKPIVGVWGAIRDASTGDACSKQSAQIIRSIVSDTDNFLKGEYYYYDFVGDRIEHTRANVVIDVCTFDEPTERAAMNAGGNCPLPDALFDAAWCGALSYLVIDDAYWQQAQVYDKYVNQIIGELNNGGTVFSPAPEQAPVAAVN